MKQYHVTLEGLTPLIMHSDNLAFSESIKAWQKDPANKMMSTAGDDRSPAWTWQGYLYHDNHTVGIPADNLMTMLREGGAKVSTGKSKETYKKHTQSGVLIDQQQFEITVEPNGKPIKVKDIKAAISDENDIYTHIKAAEKFGFELFIKRAKIGAAKHVRVRPMFRKWYASGFLSVIDEEMSGITGGILQTILNQAGALCGLGDWRPSSPKSSGTFGKFKATITEV